jgi:hypothetical protein
LLFFRGANKAVGDGKCNLLLAVVGIPFNGYYVADVDSVELISNWDFYISFRTNAKYVSCIC